MDIVPFVPHHLAKLPQEDGPLAAVLFDANFLADHPRVTCFVRPRIKGEFSQAQRLADAAERREWLERALRVNPNNEQAREALKSIAYKKSAKDNRVLVMFGVIAVILAVLAVVVVIALSSPR